MSQLWRYLTAHWTQVVFAVAWFNSHLRKSLPPEDDPKFWKTLAYNFVSGKTGEPNKPPV